MTSQLGKAPSSYLELFRLRTLPGAYRGIAIIFLAVSPPLVFAWLPQVPTVGTCSKGQVH